MATPHARGSDPRTSHIAAGMVDIEGLLLLVWKTMRDMKEQSSTWDEIKDALPNVKQDSMSNRFITLVERDYAFRIEVDRDGNEIGYVTGKDVHRKGIRYKTRACIYSDGRQLVNYWKMPGVPITRPLRNAEGKAWTPPPRQHNGEAEE